jgi:hypothetical protein
MQNNYQNGHAKDMGSFQHTLSYLQRYISSDLRPDFNNVILAASNLSRAELYRLANRFRPVAVALRRTSIIFTGAIAVILFSVIFVSTALVTVLLRVAPQGQEVNTLLIASTVLIILAVGASLSIAQTTQTLLSKWKAAVAQTKEVSENGST